MKAAFERDHAPRIDMVRGAALARAALPDANTDHQNPVDGDKTPPTLRRYPPLPPSPMVTPPSQATQPSSSVDEPRPWPVPAPAPGEKGRGVPHVYHDYSAVPDAPGFVRKKTGGVTQPFPEKLLAMLDAETAGGSDIVGWLPHGRAFLVRKPKEFTKQIMPKYFRQTKLTSFQRQLNLYGFRRITQGPDGGAYYHEMFLRGRPGLCYRMKRQKVKGTGHKQPADVNTEPNFYSMPPLQSPSPGGYDDPSAASISIAEAAQPPLHASSPMPLSPGIQSLHGAAHLLRGIASGDRSSKLPPTPFLGRSHEEQEGSEAMASYTYQGRYGSAGQRGASFLPDADDSRG